MKSKAKRPIEVTDEELVRRAYRAWFVDKIDWFDIEHLPKPGGARVYRPNTPRVAVVEKYDGHLYVILSSEKSTMAVYRIKNDGMLKRLRRWPADIEVEGGRHGRS